MSRPGKCDCQCSICSREGIATPPAYSTYNIQAQGFRRMKLCSNCISRACAPHVREA